MKKKNKKVLLIGGSGTLGSAIVNSGYFKNIVNPSKKKLNLLNKESIRKFLKKNVDIIINCAAMARMSECEKKPQMAYKINVEGTNNLVDELINFNSKSKKEIKLIHISTDGVYESTKGNYSEKSNTNPYNFYGLTKLLSEQVVKKLKKYIIIRTRFFNKSKIRFKTAATDIYTSMIEVQELVKKIKLISEKKFIGIVNIGDRKRSDFKNYKRYNNTIKPCKKRDITKNLKFKIATDASLNLNLYKKIVK